MSPVGLDRAALGALVNDLALFVAHPSDVLPGGVTPRHRPRVSQHRPGMGGQSKDGKGLKKVSIEVTLWVFVWVHNTFVKVLAFQT